MSFLKITNPEKREQIVKEYLATKKRIRDGQLAEKTGEIELQTDLSKFFRPITETQKTTAKEITEELRPIKEGIEKLPAIGAYPPALEGQRKAFEEDILKLGPTATNYLARYLRTNPDVDTTFGITYDDNRKFNIGSKIVEIEGSDIIIDGKTYKGTNGLWELIVTNYPNQAAFNKEDLDNYEEIMIKTNAVFRNNNPNEKPKSSSSFKYNTFIKPIYDKIKKKKDNNWKGNRCNPL